MHTYWLQSLITKLYLISNTEVLKDYRYTKQNVNIDKEQKENLNSLQINIKEFMGSLKSIQ